MAAPEQRGSGITISDVARPESKATASVALSGRGGVPVAPDTRRRIRETADRLGYRRNGLAAALTLGRIYTVGLVCQVDPFGEINAYHSDVMIAVTCAAARAGLRLTTLPDRARQHRRRARRPAFQGLTLIDLLVIAGPLGPA